MENGPRLALWGPRRYISDNPFFTPATVFKDHDGSPIRLLHAGSDQDLSDRQKVLDNVHLSFYPDAKIGVLGVNGSGKSTLLQDHGRASTRNIPARPGSREGARVGYLEQEPQLDARSESVRENVMVGVAKQKAILDRYNELAMNYSDETADEMTKLQDEIEAQGLWDLDSKVDQAMDALRCPPDDADVTKLSGGETPPRRALQAAARCSPTCCCSTNRPTISTPSPCPGWKAICATIRARS